MCDERCETCARYRCEIKEAIFKTKLTRSKEDIFSRNKAKRRQNLTKGLCGRCGKNPVVPGKTLCRECSEKKRAYDQKRKEREEK